MKIKYYLLPLLLFVSYLGISQSSIKRVTVYKESVSQQGEISTTRDSFLNKSAEDFRWQMYADFEESIFILRESHLKLDRKSAKRFVADQPLKKMAESVERIITIDHTGQRRVYIKQDVPDAVEDPPLWFTCAGQENCDTLSDLYLARSTEDGISPLSLFWTGKGECPEEYSEKDLPTNYMLAVLENEEGRVLMKRSIHIIEFNKGGDIWERVVEVDVETYTRKK